MFTAPPEVAPSAAGSSPVAPVLGQSSVLTLTGPEHMRQRKLLLPPFHGERMREYEDVMVEATAQRHGGLAAGPPDAHARHTRAITLEVILRAVFGVEAERMGPLKAGDRGAAEPLRHVGGPAHSADQAADGAPRGGLRPGAGPPGWADLRGDRQGAAR